MRPIFVLGVPTPQMARVGAMIGCNPDTFGTSDLNLFVEDRLELVWSELNRLGQAHSDGLLRAVACLYAGDQTMDAVQMARRWAMRRYFWPVDLVFAELCGKVAPRRLVDKSRVYGVRRGAIQRIRECIAQASFVHLVGHPGFAEATPFARQAESPFQEEEFAAGDWVRINRNICDQLEGLDPAHVHIVRLEDVAADPEATLTRLAGALGLRDDAAAIEAMLHPERSPFAAVGPIGAPYGDDRTFLREPAFRRDMPAVGGGVRLAEGAAALAERFGYTLELEPEPSEG
ncbi:sulfotransferase [Acuticoccus sp. I52.16.1]|uniref:sulfotransferase n=1 Tax=Acuticoccus sp. I52.16.1 TaxID=2928472 RepID=UPI001FD48538|nr:sulfotransferase [Acuticoccus sp. I52.16.1]UOM35546.1 sulfotransferase [Acuticoccus sp. I52.16.1]